MYSFPLNGQGLQAHPPLNQKITMHKVNIYNRVEEKIGQSSE